MMKKLLCLAIILLFVITCLGGCKDKDFVKADKDSDFSVSLPENVTNGGKENISGEGKPQVSEEERDFVGIRKLNEISDSSSTITYNNSYYIFSEDGSYSLTIANQTSNGRFSVNQGTLYLGNTPLTFKFNGDELTLYTQNNKTQKLTKIKQDN